MPALKFLVITATCLVTHLFFVQTVAANPFRNQPNNEARGEIRDALDNFLAQTLTITDDQPSIQLEDGLVGVRCAEGSDSHPGNSKKCRVYYFMGQIDWSKSDDPTYIQGFFYANKQIHFARPSAVRHIPGAAVFTLTALIGKFTPFPIPATYLPPGDTVSTEDAFPSKPDAPVYLVRSNQRRYSSGQWKGRGAEIIRAGRSLIFETSRPLPILELAFFSSGTFDQHDLRSGFSNSSEADQAHRVWQEFVDTPHLMPFLHHGGSGYFSQSRRLLSNVDAKKIFGAGILCRSLRSGSRMPNCLEFYSRHPYLGGGDDAEPVVLYDIHTRGPFLNSDKLTPYFREFVRKKRGQIPEKAVFMPFGVISLSALEQAGIELPDDALIWDPQADTPQTFFPHRYSGNYWPVETLGHHHMLYWQSTPSVERKTRSLPDPSE